MISLPIDESGRKKAPFTRPDVPTDAPREVCRTCGGPARTEDVKCWTKALGDHRKRFFSCVNKVRCPKRFEYIDLTDEQKEEVMAKARTLAQTPEWCEKIKAGCLEKHIKYQDLGRLSGLSEACLKQALNQHCTLSAESQKRVEDALAAYVPGMAIQNGPRVKPPRKTQAKSATQKAFESLPASLQVSESMGKMVDAMAQETQETILRNLEAQEAVPPGATVTWGEEQPKPGLIQPSEELVIIDVTGPTTFLEKPTGLPTGTGKASDAPDPSESLERRTRIKGLDAIPASLDIAAPGTLSQLSVMQFQFQDLVQRQRALECRVQSLAERAEERFTAFAQGHQLHEDRLGRMDDEQLELQTEQEQQDAANEKRFQDLEDRITSTYDHLTEQIGKLQPWVVPPPPETSNWTWSYCPPLTPPSLDEVVDALSKYSDSQLAALVTAATARRDLLKAMEAA